MSIPTTMDGGIRQGSLGLDPEEAFVFGEDRKQ